MNSCVKVGESTEYSCIEQLGSVGCGWKSVMTEKNGLAVPLLHHLSIGRVLRKLTEEEAR